MPENKPDHIVISLAAIFATNGALAAHSYSNPAPTPMLGGPGAQNAVTRISAQ